MKKIFVCVSSLLVLSFLVVGCGGHPNDPSYQAKELKDPSTRIEAVQNLNRIYSEALANHNGDRTHTEVKAIADASVNALTETYIEVHQDYQLGEQILRVLAQMRDPRSIGALLVALDWRREASESHAVAAAQTLRDMNIPQAKYSEVIHALMKAYEKITTDRPQDQLIAKSIVEALGNIGNEAVEPLIQIAMRQSDHQNFLVNRIALMKLSKIGSSSAVSALIKGLFFRSRDLRFGMEDVAIGGLVRVGRPALGPLLQLLQGLNSEANRAAEQQIMGLQAINQSLGMTAQSLVAQRACSALGALGMQEAFGPILAEVSSDDLARKVTAAGSLLSLTLNEQESLQAREVVTNTIRGLPNTFEGYSAKAALISQGLNTFDAGWLPFFIEQGNNQSVHPDVRLIALQSYVLLANKQEILSAKQLIEREPKSADADGGQKERFAAFLPLIEVTELCDQDVSCWVNKLNDSNALVVQKAAVMLGRLGRNQQQAIDSLISLFTHNKVEVRLVALVAVDRIAIHGSPAAIQKIDEIAIREEGQRVWSIIAAEAMRVQNRLRSRNDASHE